MKKINKSRYAILGMLFDKPMTGYEIKKFMQESTTHFWQESDASLYPMLKKLEAEGKVQAQITRKGRLERIRYAITNTGKKEFAYWMEQEAEPGTHRDELLLKLFFGAHSSPNTIIQHLQAKKLKLQEQQKKYAHLNMLVEHEVAPDDQHKRFWLMAIRNGVLSSEAELKWIDECLKLLNE
jgi:DNA-binding PadR family transcriptional regulator